MVKAFLLKYHISFCHIQKSPSNPFTLSKYYFSRDFWWVRPQTKFIFAFNFALSWCCFLFCLSKCLHDSMHITTSCSSKKGLFSMDLSLVQLIKINRGNPNPEEAIRIVKVTSDGGLTPTLLSFASPTWETLGTSYPLRILRVPHKGFPSAMSTPYQRVGQNKTKMY